MSITRNERKTTPHGISYISYGPAKSRLCLVCIHGWACQATDFSHLFTQLINQVSPYHAIAVDLPGYGQSSSTKYPDASLESMASAVLKLISELEVDNVILVGHSMGMRIVLECWHRSRTGSGPNVKGLVFLDGSHYKLRKSLFAFDSADARSESLSQEQKLIGMEAAFKRMFSPKTPMDFQSSTLARLRTMDFEYSNKMRDSFIDFDYNRMDDLLDALGKAGTPLLSLQATDVDDQNQRIPLEPGVESRWMQFLRRKVPQTQIDVVKNSGHFPHVDQPVETASRMGDFVNYLQT